MTLHDTHDPVFEGLQRLQSLAPDRGRTALVRMRCRTQLARSGKRLGRREVITGFARKIVAPVVVVGFCIFYVAALVTTTLRLHGVFR